MKKALKLLYIWFRKLMQLLLTKPITWLVNQTASAPNKQAVFVALTKLYQQTIDPNDLKRGTLFELSPASDNIIIFSDQHKGRRNGADDFSNCEQTYLEALKYYSGKNYYYINLGDSEELWENNIFSVLNFNKATFDAEKEFVNRNALCKIYGNHDSLWRFDPLASVYLKQMYGIELKIFGAIALRVPITNGQYFDIFCTHGHQGDARSDGNWFSAAFVTYVWGPLQAFLGINTNTPSDSPELKTIHNQMMYEWSATNDNLVLITGHTHQPVFNSLTHLERLLVRRDAAIANNSVEELQAINAEIPKREMQFPHISEASRKAKPSYFNTGCCCYNNGTITGIEISEGKINLIKWSNKNGKPERTVLEQTNLLELGKNVCA